MLFYGRYLNGKGLLEKAIEVYTKASDLGSLAAKLHLAQIYAKIGHKQSMITYMKKSLENPEIATRNLIYCGDTLKAYAENKLAFVAYQKAAERNNPYGLLEVIQGLELGRGVEKNRQLARTWRKKLPKGWENASMTNFFKHLQKTTQPEAIPAIIQKAYHM